MLKFFGKKEKVSGPNGTLAIGCGGSGCNIVNRLGRMSNVDILTINTDSKGLVRSRSNKRILLGTGSAEGCNGDIEKGRSLTKEAEDVIGEHIGRYHDILIFTGLGGGTGTGSSEIIGNMAKRNGSRVVTIATIPMSFESERRKKAFDSVPEIKKACDILLLLDGDMLAKKDPMLGAREAFSVLDQMVCETFIGMTEMFVADNEVFAMMKDNTFTASFAEGYKVGKIADILSNGIMMDHPAISQPLIFVTGNIPGGGHEIIENKILESTGMIPTFIQGREDRGMRLLMFVPV
ncbi:MAG: hypothetical protein FWD37_05570 [Methanomassiliicoccaceae archaeon]|nr:hypothetical protein [Methanomassiliicoccaceae archaeon]